MSCVIRAVFAPKTFFRTKSTCLPLWCSGYWGVLLLLLLEPGLSASGRNRRKRGEFLAGADGGGCGLLFTGTLAGWKSAPGPGMVHTNVVIVLVSLRQNSSQTSFMSYV